MISPEYVLGRLARADLWRDLLLGPLNSLHSS